MRKKLSFEAKIKELEDIVFKLEEGTESLEDSLKLFEEGIKAANFCYNTIKEAEQKITDLSKLEKEDKANGGNDFE